ncbi:MAG: helicase HerA-like domain-containing protein, partial [Methyloceanibacter sp.]
IIDASPVAGVYDETVDRDSAYEILQKRIAKQADTEVAQGEDKAAGRTTGGKSRADSFWTTFGKTLVRTGVPLVTKVLTDALKGRTRKGG